MTARALMFQGTGSDVGKSLIVAGLARVFHRRGLRVQPFKPQNMSNNAAVTADGGEIGRAQALQARAAGVQPTVHMNPVLLKPQSDIGSQVVVQGRVWGTAKAKAFQAMKPELLASVLESFRTLADDADLVLVEGAGSASEVNLREGDIANMGFAQAANVPVVVIGDIDRGGVIASLVGTKSVIAKTDAAMIKGFIVNRFRGDPTLFADGMALISDKTGWAALGLVPYFTGAYRLPAEDMLALDRGEKRRADALTIAVLAYPRMSNFDDFDPLRLEANVNLIFLRQGEPIPAETQLAILPGSKSTIADLHALRETGWDTDLRALIRRGGHVLGICGGYQMLGQQLSDPDGIEGAPGTVDGLGFIDIQTVLTGDKTLTEVSGTSLDQGVPFRGYEMHVGVTNGPACERPLFIFSSGEADGAKSPDGRVSGTYIHGLFSNDGQRASWLSRLGANLSGLNYEEDVEATLDGLADHLERHVDCDRLLKLADRVSR